MTEEKKPYNKQNTIGNKKINKGHIAVIAKWRLIKNYY